MKQDDFEAKEDQILVFCLDFTLEKLKSVSEALLCDILLH